MLLDFAGKMKHTLAVFVQQETQSVPLTYWKGSRSASARSLTLYL